MIKKFSYFIRMVSMLIGLSLCAIPVNADFIVSEMQGFNHNVTVVGPPTGCPTIGNVCSDGTVYAGLSPDGSVAMYVTKCDLGMSWDGSSCTGTRSRPAWNNGNATGYVTTGFTSNTDGDGNTAGLVATDSDSGTGGVQPHQAAQACSDLDSNGRTDWYLPANDELILMRTNKVAIGNFDTSGSDPNGYYFSSSEATNNLADSIRFTTLEFSSGKENGGNLSIRCARK